jgi:hypothetical protein
MITLRIGSLAFAALLVLGLTPSARSAEKDNKETESQDTKSSKKKGGKAAKAAPAMTKSLREESSGDSPSVERLLPDGGRTGDPIGGLPGNKPQGGNKEP